MTTTARVDLTAAMLARGWWLDVNTGTHASPTWTPVSGIMDITPDNKATMKDASTADGAGALASQKTADQWSLKLKLKRAPQSASPSAYDVGQEALRAKSLLHGASNLAEIRWYEVNGDGGTNAVGTVHYPVTEAWTGYAAVEWTEANGAQDDIRVADVTLTGHGARTAVAPNPASA